MQHLSKFRKTKLGYIPIDWELIEFWEVVDFSQLGCVIRTRNNIDKLLLLKMGNLTFGGFNFDKLEYIDKNQVQNYESFLLKDGDFLFNTRNSEDLVGKCAVWKKEFPEAIFDNNILRIRFNQEKIYSADYISYLFNSHFGRKILERFIKRTTSVAAIYYKDLQSYKLLLPSLKEQQKIASILSNVDELIQKIEQIIEQTHKLKKGLMQRLLTKGIGHTKFKKTEVGEIPEQWNMVEIGEITTKITDIDHKMPKKVQHGIPFVTVKYLTKDDSYYFNLIHNTDLEYILEEDFKYHSKKFNAEYGDLLISRYGTIGITKMINTQEKLIASYSIALIKPKRDLIFPLFLTHALNSDKIKRQIQSFIEQSSNTNLDLLRIKKIKVPKPNLEEQQKISSIISYIDLLIQKRRKLKLEFEKLKKGLMQQLLTGKIRVKF